MPPKLPQRLLLRGLDAVSEAGAGDAMLRWAIRRPDLTNRGYQAPPPGAGDVVISTYLKSGTNWMTQLAAQTAWAGRARFTHVHELVPWPDAPIPLPATTAAPRRSPGGLQVIKTHEPAGGVPLTDDARYIVVVRDPKDVLVSSHHFVLGILGAVLAGHVTPTGWLDAFCSDRFCAGSWAAHLAAWWPLRHRDNVLLLTFREMKADLPGVQRRVESHLGLTLDGATRAEVLRLASFAHMKSVDDAFGSIGPTLRAPPPAMVRAGRVGSRELYSDADRVRVDAWCRAGLTRLGCDFPYDTTFGTASPAQWAARPRSPHVRPGPQPRAHRLLRPRLPRPRPGPRALGARLHRLVRRDPPHLRHGQPALRGVHAGGRRGGR
jgi:hypothetical protein